MSYTKLLEKEFYSCQVIFVPEGSNLSDISIHSKMKVARSMISVML